MKKNLLNFVLVLGLLIPVLAAPTSKVLAATITLGPITPSTNVSVGTTITFQATVDNYSTQQYTLTDSFPGSTLSNSKITKFGQFSWTPDHGDVGTHNVVITAIDLNGNKISLNQTFVIGQASAVSIKDLTPGPNLFPDKNLSFSVAALGYIKPTYSLYDSFSGSTLSNSNINSDGNAGWTPKTSDVGIHNIRIVVSSPNGRTDTVYQTITVNGLALKSISSTKVPVGTQLRFTLTPFGMTNPTYTIGDSLRNNTSDSMAISGNDFSWTPLTQDIGTHVFTISGRDTYGLVGTIKLTIRVISGNSNQATSNAIENKTTVSVPAIKSSASTPNNATVYVFKNNLDTRSKGSEVTELQKKLKAEGYYNGPITGTFGPLTKAAVIKFQKAKKISAQGNVGPATRAALNKI